jgi:diguanylate cyclase (GGDEF)-like protein
MEIRDTKPVRGAGASRKAEARAAVAETGAPAPAEPTDILNLAGIGETELTPRLRQAILGLMAEVDTLRRELGDARQRIGYLERLADEDPLMPIANRRAFVRELTRMMSFAQRYGTAASIVYIDVNDMKLINDSNSHAAGDAALMQVARVLLDNVRNTDVVGRLGGDELGVLLVQTDQPLAEQKAAQLAGAVAATPLRWQDRDIPLSISYGVYSFSGSENAGEALDAADRAMYQAKRQRSGAPDPARA